MELNENEMRIVKKVNFYKTNEIQAHVFVISKSRFKNGLFASDLQEGEDPFFWFIELGSSIPHRLFLYEIYDMEDYRERGE